MATTPVFLPGKSHGQQNLMDYSPWGRKESDTTQWLRTHTELLLLTTLEILVLWSGTQTDTFNLVWSPAGGVTKVWRPGLSRSVGPGLLHSWGSWLPGHSVRTGSSELGEMPSNSWISLTSQEAKQKFLLWLAFFSLFKYLKEFLRDFSSSPLVKTLSFHCRGYR